MGQLNSYLTVCVAREVWTKCNSGRQELKSCVVYRTVCDMHHTQPYWHQDTHVILCET